MAKESEIKGQAIRTTQLVIGELWGDDTARQVVNGLTADFRQALDAGSIVTSGWYPISWYRQFHDMLAQLLPNELDFARRLGRATTEKDLSGIYKFILKLTSPTLLARHFDKVASSYLRGGQLEVVVYEKTFSVEAHGWHGMTTSLWNEGKSGIELIFERTSARAVTSQLRVLSNGSARAEFSWH